MSLLLAHILSEHWSGRIAPAPLSASVFLLLLTLHTIPELNPDAARYFTEAKFLAVEGVGTFISEWGGKLYVYVDQPLVPFIYGVLFILFGESRLVIQAYNFLLYSLLVLLVYRISAELWDRRAAGFSAMLMLASPYVLSRVPMTLVDVTLSFLTAALAYSLLLGLRRRRAEYLVPAGICVALIPFTKLTGLVYLLPLAFVPLALHLSGERLALRQLAVPVLLGAALALPLLLHLAPVLREQISLAMILKSRMPEITGAESVWNLLFYQFSAPVTLLALAGTCMALRRGERGILLPLLWFLVPLILYHDTRMRYMIPAYPALAMLAGFGLFSLSERWNRGTAVFLALAAVLSSLSLLYLAYVPFAHANSAADLMRSAAYAERIPVESIDVYALYPASYNSSLALLIPLFDLHSSKRVIVRGESLMPTREITPEQKNVSWTWSFELPGYYFQLAPPSELVAVISPMYYTYLPPMLKERLKNYTLVRTFEAGTYGALFPYKIRLYLRNPTVSFGALPAELRKGEVVNVSWSSGYPFPQDLSYRVYLYSESQKMRLYIGELRNTSILWKVPLLPPAEDYRFRVYASWNGWQTYGWNDSRRMRAVP